MKIWPRQEMIFGTDLDTGSFLSILPTWSDRQFLDIEEYYSKSCWPIFTKLGGWVRRGSGMK